MTVKVTITGGPATDVVWTNGMNAQTAMERAFENLTHDTPSGGKVHELVYSLEYYGSSLGFLVNMINETYDTFKSTSHPYFYWEFLVNEQFATKGIDQTILNDSDEITFSYKTYDTSHSHELVAAKHLRRSS